MDAQNYKNQVRQAQLNGIAGVGAFRRTTAAERVAALLAQPAETLPDRMALADQLLAARIELTCDLDDMRRRIDSIQRELEDALNIQPKLEARCQAIEAALKDWTP